MQQFVEVAELCLVGEERFVPSSPAGDVASASEWRLLSEVEQRSMIRAEMTDSEDLPELVPAEVEEMLAKARSVPSSA